MAKKLIVIIVALISIIAMVLPGCEGEGELQPIPFRNPNMFVEQTIGDIDSLDPAWIYDTASAQQVGYIYETLIYYDGESTDEFVPVLATEWAYDTTDNTLRFKIREGVKFHNGNDLTPEDVEYTFERAMVQDRPGGPVWMFFQPLLGVWGLDDTDFAAIDPAVGVDGDWVVFTLVGDYWELPFMQILCGGWASIVDREWCIAQGDWDGTAEDIDRVKHPANAGDTPLYDQANGTGPWELDAWVPNDQIIVKRSDGYWRDPAPFEYVVTKVVDEWSARKLALQNGDADIVYVPATNYPEMDEMAQTYILNVYEDLPSLTIDALFFNMDINPESTYIGTGELDGEGIPVDFFSDIDVRKGFCYAFDYDTYIADALNGQGEQRGSPVVEGLPYFNPDAPMYEYDLEQAEEHLRAAWDGQVWENGFKLTLLYNAGNLPRKTACEILAENLYSLNPKFQVSIQPLAWPVILGKIFGTRDMPIFQIGWLPDYPHPDNFIVPFMHSTGTFSQFQGYGSAELDAKIEAAFKETDPTLQQQKYYELQQIYYQDAPGIVLAQPLARRYFTGHITGFYYNPVEPAFPGRVYDLRKSES
jgi:peptide/nickel transport system substrate-binding protein